MNGQTNDLITRPYAELVEDILTSLLGGVVNEPVRFDSKQPAFPLSRRAQALRGVSGTSGGQHHTFLPEQDFRLAATGDAVVWVDGGARPDEGTLFYVDYTVPGASPPLTDVNIGSVVRTICEAVGREIAALYEVVNLAYRSGFVDTAEGKALDLVVAILDITRFPAGTAEGLVTFIRDPNVDGDITVPANLELVSADRKKRFRTIEERTLQRGQQRLDVPARAQLGGAEGSAGAGEITAVAQPLAGIEKITNLAPTVPAAAETDEQLRLRARQALRGLGKATIAALSRAILDAGGTPVAFMDPVTRPESPAGQVTAVVAAEPERLPSIRDAVQATRAAGVFSSVIGRFVFVTVRMRATVPAGTPAAGQDAVRAAVVAAMGAYIDGLTVGEALSAGALRDAVATVPGLTTPQAVEVIAAPQDLAPAGTRHVDPGLVTSTAPERAGQPPTDADLAAWAFAVSAQVSGEAWSIALETGPTDIELVEAGGAG